MGRKVKDLTGLEKNQLIVRKLITVEPKYGAWYLVECKCGNMKILQGKSITSGNTKSCGCLKNGNRTLL